MAHSTISIGVDDFSKLREDFDVAESAAFEQIETNDYASRFWS